MSRVLIACDKFKGTLTSVEVADALGAGMARSAPGATIGAVPVADGGDGSLAVALFAGAREVGVDVADAEGRVRRVAIAVAPGAMAGPGLAADGPSCDEAPTGPGTAAAASPGRPLRGGPSGDRVSSSGPVATVEVASICGLGARRPTPGEALRASSAGVGQAIRAALDRGARTIVLAVGGTATSDGGAGMLAALGARLTDAERREIGPGALGLTGLGRVELDGLDPRLAEARLVVATDVDSPLLGTLGAAAVFSAQKGADREAVEIIEGALARWAELSSSAVPNGVPAGAPGAGAGGGLGYAAMLLGGSVRSGAAYFLDLAGFDTRCAGADLVVTGEGRLDAQTLHGKAPAVVARRARDAGVRCRAVVGSRDLPDAAVRSAGFEAVDAIADLDPACATDAELSRDLLGVVGMRIGADLAAG